MGLDGSWAWLRNQKIYHPGLIHPSSRIVRPPQSKIRVDVCGSFYASIRWAYTRFRDSKVLAHEVLLNILKRLGQKDYLVFYIDGRPALEKQQTHDRRRQQREGAVKMAEKGLELIEARRQHFQTCHKAINNAFHWGFDIRQEFAQYLLERQYHMIFCSTEADPRIAEDCEADDIVISSDSDFLGYQHVRTIWRPVGHASANKCPVYKKSDVLDSLHLTDIQLTALACVAKNDYESNIPNLGLITNYDIIKELGSSDDVKTLVAKYLIHPKVVRNNTSKLEFCVSPQVFCHHIQMSIGDGPTEEEDWERLCFNFVELKIAINNKRLQLPLIKISHAPGHLTTRDIRTTTAIAPLTSLHAIVRQTTMATTDRDTASNLKPTTPEQEMRWKESQNKKEATIANTTATKTRTEVKACVEDIASQALVIKRDTQIFIGQYIEAAYAEGSTDDDRSILAAMCPPVSTGIKNCCIADNEEVEEDEEEGREGDQQDDDVDNDDGDDTGGHKQFFQVLLTHMYSRREPPQSKAGRNVQRLISRASKLQIALPARRQWSMSYSANDLLQSVSSQICNEIKRMYLTGSRELEQKIDSKDNHNAPADGLNIKDMAVVAASIIKEPPTDAPMIEELPAPVDPPRIDNSLLAIENYLVLNQLVDAPRRIVPLSPIRRRYVSFGERQLITMFWKWEPLKQKQIEMVKNDRYFKNPDTVPSQVDTQDWSMPKSPGFILTQFVMDIGRPQTTAAKDTRGYRKHTKLMDIEDIKEHLQDITHPDFDANTYKIHGFALKGSLKTNGHLVQLTAFKLHELQSVRYRRLAVDKMPNSLTSTIGGTNQYLKEIRNVVGTSGDVQKIWNCPPDDVAILALDLGTEGLVGSTVHLLSGIHDINQMKRRKTWKTARGKRSKKQKKRRSQTKCKLRPSPITAMNFDLFVKRRSVAQPTQRFQHWLEF
ncbi:hypothetical protein FBU30_007140 [Linnemannia zychae]|nr:hypothetical protein FBU30_007140 [Linnemannia zychae]